MKKYFSQINRNTILYGLLVFLTAAAFIPANYMGIEASDLSINFSAQALLTVLTVAFFSSLCAVAVQKLVTAENGVLAPLAVMIFADPLLRCAFMSYTHLLILTAAIGILLCMTADFSLRAKTIAASVFAFVSALILPEAAFSCIAVVFMAYIITATQKKSVAPEGKGKKTKSEKKFDIKLLSPLIIVAACIAASLLSSEVSAHLSPLYSLTFQYTSAASFTGSVNFWIAAIPYFTVLLLFVKEYTQAKTAVTEKSAKVLAKCAIILWPVILALIIILAGAFVLGFASSVTVFNLACAVAVVALYRADKENAGTAISRIYEKASKYNCVIAALFVVWLLATQYLFQNVQHTLLDILLSLTGSLL